MKSSKGAVLDTLIFDASILGKEGSSYCLENPFLKEATSLAPYIDQIIQEKKGKNPLYQERCASIVVDFVAETLRNHPYRIKEKTSKNDEHYLSLLEKIEKEYASITFEDAVEFMGFAAPYFSSYFKKKAAEMAHARGVTIEAEIGALPSREDGSENKVDPSSLFSDPDLAKKFVEETGIDALAASFGTAHGIYKIQPKLDFERIEKIASLTSVPLVMHGGSGDYHHAIDCGISKINYYSYMAREGVRPRRSAWMKPIQPSTTRLPSPRKRP